MKTADNTSRAFAGLACALFGTVALCALAAAPVLAAPAPLFAPAAGARAPDAPTDRSVVRQRAVQIDWALLRQLASDANLSVTLKLFDDASFAGVGHWRELHGPDVFSLVGELTEDKLGSFSLTVSRKVVVGMVRAPQSGSLFRIETTSDGSCVVSQIDPSKLGGCEVDLKAPPADAAAKGMAASLAGLAFGDSGEVIDLLVVYTSWARFSAGGVANIEAEIEQAVLGANVAYANSQITTRLRLVHMEEVPYVVNGGFEDGTFADHLRRLENPSDGYMDNVPALRDLVAADLVCLIVQDTDNDTICGKGGLTDRSYRRYASVVSRVCGFNELVLAHEVGHNMGCDHDVGNATEGPNDLLYPYAYGWRFNGNSGNQWRTIMAYEPGLRIQNFSNPNVLFDGQATGVPDAAENARVINNTASLIANYRPGSVTWVDFFYGGMEQGLPERGRLTQPYYTVTEGIAAAPIGSIVRIKSSNRLETGDFIKPVTLQAFGGPVTIGR